MYLFLICSFAALCCCCLLEECCFWVFKYTIWWWGNLLLILFRSHGCIFVCFKRMLVGIDLALHLNQVVELLLIKSIVFCNFVSNCFCWHWNIDLSLSFVCVQPCLLTEIINEVWYSIILKKTRYFCWASDVFPFYFRSALCHMRDYSSMIYVGSTRNSPLRFTSKPINLTNLSCKVRKLEISSTLPNSRHSL